MRKIHIDYKSVKGLHDKAYRFCVGSGHAALGLRQRWQQQFARTCGECGFQYIRFHGLLCDDMDVYREEEGQPVYNWMFVDELYDAILAAGAKPFVELSFMPYALASGEKTVFWWKANVTPPKDLARWEELIRRLTRHLTDRYGAEEVASWYFEVWNEPDHPAFFSAGMEEYFAMYAAASRAIKSVNPAYRVGGPATACAIWIPELIAFCEREKLGIDFVTYHAYGLSHGHFDEFGTENFILSPKPEMITEVMERVYKEVNSSSRPDLEIHMTEWGASYSSRDSLHDGYVSAAYVLYKLKQCEGLADSMSYWTFSDIFEETGPAPRPFHGGFGLLNMQGLAKPQYYSYQWLNRLGEEELDCEDSNAWACRDNNGGAQVLLWDYTYLEQDSPNREFYAKELPAQSAGPVDVSLDHLPEGEYRLRIYRVGYRRNDVYTAYLDMGSPDAPSKEQIAQLAAASDGSPEVDERIALSGKWTRRFELQQNEVVLITLDKA